MIKIFFLFFLFLFVYADDDCFCRLRTNKKIIKGKRSVKNSFPWLISLAEDGNHICGGTIINKRLVLTAAHCIENKSPIELQVRVGVHNVEKIPDEQVYEIKKIHSHKYKGIEVPGDIAILELFDDIKFKEGVVEKACFNLKNIKYPSALLAAGWGNTKLSVLNPETEELEMDGDAKFLKQAYFIQKAKCKRYLICLKPETKGDSICQGDSGGPLHYIQNGFTSVEGVASYVDAEERNGKTVYCTGNSAYSRLSYYAKWFKDIVGEDFCVEPKKKGILESFFQLFKS